MHKEQVAPAATRVTGSGNRHVLDDFAVAPLGLQLQCLGLTVLQMHVCGWAFGSQPPTHANKRTSTYSKCTHAHTPARTRMRTPCVYVHMYARKYICMHAYTHAHAHTPIHAHIHICTYTHIFVQT